MSGDFWRAPKVSSTKGLKNATAFLLEQANRGVPLEESTLEKSGKASVDDGKQIGAVSYDTPYARRQHEDTNLHHTGGRTDHWLQKALTDNAGKLNELIAGGTELT